MKPFSRKVKWFGIGRLVIEIITFVINTKINLQACDTIRTDILRAEHHTNNVNISQQIFSDLGEVVKCFSDPVFKEKFFEMCDAMSEYTGLDSRNLEEMVFEEVNLFEDTSKPIIYRHKKTAFNKRILPINYRHREPDMFSKRGPKRFRRRFEILEDMQTGSFLHHLSILLKLMSMQNISRVNLLG